jgi:RNA polymerase sigma factor (sigma-70 family)
VNGNDTDAATPRPPIPREWPPGPDGEQLTAAEVVELERVARTRIIGIVSPSLRPNAADDVVQDAMGEFLIVWRREHVEHPDRLVRTIARRKAWRYQAAWERRRPWPAIFADDDTDAAWAPEDHDAAARQRPDPLVAVENRDALRWAINQLDDRHQPIGRLAYLHEPPLNAKQIAERLGLAHGTVRNRLVDIRHALQDLLTDDDTD